MLCGVSFIRFKVGRINSALHALYLHLKKASEKNSIQHKWVCVVKILFTKSTPGETSKSMLATISTPQFFFNDVMMSTIQIRDLFINTCNTNTPIAGSKTLVRTIATYIINLSLIIFW